jgi:hypothetical protein
LLEFAQAWLRGKRCIAIFIEQAEQPSHFGKGLSRTPLSRLKTLICSGLVAALEQPARSHELQHQHADAVPDHVVQLARDPSALLGSSRARLRAALAFERLGTP